ncbi:hypothetical protein HPP92_023212 [Vanilla planifolia]|uniref:Uncharacterized protein n=1 Tax=Vanilla planifolia TaxID=51239 RepID=A0A835PSX9_VANPL|nr:hypothetical protein HPP92_023212 [Vanilla planifolia]
MTTIGVFAGNRWTRDRVKITPILGPTEVVANLRKTKLLLLFPTSVLPVDEDQIAANLVKHGLFVANNAVFMQFPHGWRVVPTYAAGVRTMVTLVGYGSGHFAKSNPKGSLSGKKGVQLCIPPL